MRIFLKRGIRSAIELNRSLMLGPAIHKSPESVIFILSMYKSNLSIATYFIPFFEPYKYILMTLNLLVSATSKVGSFW